MTDRERGARIQQRLKALRMSDPQFHERTGIDLHTVRRAIAAEGVGRSTYELIERWLDRLDHGA